jgi:DNA repair photolyase
MQIEMIDTERALSPTNIELADYVINPYKGCEFGCAYCYVQSNGGIKKIQKEWGEYVFVKQNFVELLQKEVEKAGDIKRVLIGSTTEPFQSVEQRYQLSRQTLSILASHKIPFVILTKSPLILDCKDLLSYSDQNRIYFTFNAEEVRSLFEKRSFSQQERLKAIKELWQAGIDVIVYIGPVFPLITEPALLFKELKGVTKKIYLEAYHPKLGNWDEILSKLGVEREEFYRKIYSSEAEYQNYWNNFAEETKAANREYAFELEFFVPKFNSYYKG